MTKKKRRAWRRKRGLKGSEGNEPEALPLAVVDKPNKVTACTASMYRHSGLLQLRRTSVVRCTRTWRQTDCSN